MAHAWKACWGQPLTSSNLVSSAPHIGLTRNRVGPLSFLGHIPLVHTTGQVLTVFRSRLRPEGTTEYEATAALMSSLATSMPGYVEHKAFTADDGERVTVVTFADRASHQAWRDHPDHRAAQRRGRDEFYATYSIQVADVTYVSEL